MLNVLRNPDDKFNIFQLCVCLMVFLLFVSIFQYIQHESKLNVFKHHRNEMMHIANIIKLTIIVSLIILVVRLIYYFHIDIGPKSLKVMIPVTTNALGGLVVGIFTQNIVADLQKFMAW